jgi:cytochrome c
MCARLMRTALASFVVALVASLTACGSGGSSRPIGAGSPSRGGQLIERYGCGGCHTIPGVDDATGRVAPSLAGFAGSRFIAHALPNTLPNLVRWIENPQRVAPGTRMPSVGVKPRDARDIAADLYRKT